MINYTAINSMKSSAVIINTARGKLINEGDLVEELNTSRIAGVALDVLSSEPPSKDNPLLNAKNCIITPHIAWTAREALSRLMYTAVNNLEGFLKGNIINCVNDKER